MPIWLREKLFQKKFIFDYLKNIDNDFKDDTKLLFSEHHLSHAASAFYPSPFEEAIILTADGVGEWATTTVAIGKKNNLEIKKEMLPVANTRKISKKDMVLNNICPEIEVNPETYEVKADGELLTCEPASELPLAQRYFLY